MTTPVEQVASLRIGSVESVSPSQSRVVLELDAPEATALNAGVPTAFPRINNYVLVPNEGSALVGMIVWIGVEPSSFPKRRGLKDFDLVDLPFPLRRMAITPVGTLVRRQGSTHSEPALRFERGVNRYPSVGDAVLLTSPDDVKATIESHGSDGRVAIGRSAMASDAIISVDPDKLFGRHLAVLGNTGSGKSCSVAGLIHWSLERSLETTAGTDKPDYCNARFIILDPNGEYGSAFDNLGKPVRRYRVTLSDEDTSEEGGGWLPLRLPAWLWNSHEWCSFASAAPGVQRPLLLQGLRDMRAGKTIKQSHHRKALRLFQSFHALIASHIAEGPGVYGKFPGSKNVGLLCRRISDDAERYKQGDGDCFDALLGKAKDVADSRDSSYTDRKTGEFKDSYDPFSETDLTGLLSVLGDTLNACKEVLGEEATEDQPREDAPIQFDVSQLPDHLKQLAANWKSANAAQFADFLAMRVQMILDDQRLRRIITPDQMPTLAEWLENYVGANNSENGPVCIIDLSLVPADILQMVIAVLSRLVFEAVQRYRRFNGVELPTVLVLEEAHSFVRRSRDEDAETGFATSLCRNTFERIAREGRKFGLGMVLSSQRPSEISATVLAQCNTFLLHRLVNDRDQEMVKRLVPEMLGGLLSELPNLPTKQAILLGWATPIPVLVEMNELAENQRPRSADPSFWDVWTGQQKREINWQAIADDWTN